MTATLRDMSNLQLLLKDRWATIDAYPIDQTETRRLHQLLYVFMMYYIEHPIADWSLTTQPRMLYLSSMKHVAANNNRNTP